MLCVSCGKKTMKPVFVQHYDLHALSGIPAFVDRMRILRCTSCDAETVEGKFINRVLLALTAAVASLPRRLTGEEARYLRKSLMLTQEELGQQIGANKVTISDWERGDAQISEHYDFILRGRCLAELAQKGLESVVIQTMPKALAAMHRDVPKKPDPVEVPWYLLEAEGTAEAAENY